MTVPPAEPTPLPAVDTLAPTQPQIPTTKRTNGWAITSLICGILGCLPLPSVLAVIFAVVGFRKARNPQMGGKGFAIAGLILGVVGSVMWVVIGSFAAYMYIASAQPRALVQQFAQELSDGNAEAAIAHCTNDVSPSTVDATISTVKQFGPLRGVRTSSVNLSPRGESLNVWELSGSATFTDRTVLYRAIIYQQGDVFRIAEFRFTDLQR